MWALVEAVRVSGRLRLAIVDGVVRPKQLGGSSQLHMAELLDLDEQPAFPHLCFSGGPWGKPQPVGLSLTVLSQNKTRAAADRHDSIQKSALSLESEGPDLAILGFFPHPFWLIFSPRGKWGLRVALSKA